MKKQLTIKYFEQITDISNRENDLPTFSKEDKIKLFENQTIVNLYNSNGDVVGSKVMTSKKDLTMPIGEVWLSEILYTKNGILYSHINKVSPSYNVITDMGTNLGTTQLFSTALNTKQTNFNSKTDKIIYLTTTTKDLYVDSIKKENKLKETFGHNLIESLWPYIESNKIKIQLLPNNKQTTLKEINANNLLNLETIEIPLYDSTGGSLSVKLVVTKTTPNIFDKITITQVWYYNDTKNIVFCKIPSALLTVKKYPDNDFMNNTVRQIKLVF